MVKIYYKYYLLLQMSIENQKIWTQYEYEVLKTIILQKKITKWNLVSKILHQQYQIQGYTGKQCRQQWNNSIISNINLQQWTTQQEEKLYQYHNLYGNKWATISLFLPGRSDNSIKNHFYSTLRKAFRGINRFICEKKKRTQLKPFKNIVMGKIIGLAQQGLQKKNETLKQVQQKNCIDIYSGSIALKNKLMKYASKSEKDEGQQEAQIQSIIKDITAIMKVYKCRKLKRKKKNQIQEKQQQIQIKGLPKKQSQFLEQKKSPIKLSFKKFQPKESQIEIKKQQIQEKQHEPISLQTMSSLPYLPNPQNFFMFPNNIRSYMPNNLFETQMGIMNLSYLSYKQYYQGMMMGAMNNFQLNYEGEN